MKIAKKIFTILCDDIREEKGGKLSLIGIYSKSIVFKEVPTIYPKLCLAIFAEGLKEVVSDIKVVLKTPKSDDVVVKLKAPPELSSNENIALAIPISPFSVKTTGQAKFHIYFGDAKRPSLTHEFEIDATGKK